jgi:hypothetical protein
MVSCLSQFVKKRWNAFRVLSRPYHRKFFLMAQQPLGGLGRLIVRRFTITHIRHTTLGRTPLDECTTRRRDLYLTTHNTHKRQTSMPPEGFEPKILVSERPKTHSLDRAATEGVKGPIVITKVSCSP